MTRGPPTDGGALVAARAQLERVADRNERGEGVVCETMEAVEARVGEGDHASWGWPSAVVFSVRMVGSTRHRTSRTKGTCSDNGRAVGGHEGVRGGERVRAVGARGEAPGACTGGLWAAGTSARPWSTKTRFPSELWRRRIEDSSVIEKMYLTAGVGVDGRDREDLRRRTASGLDSSFMLGEETPLTGTAGSMISGALRSGGSDTIKAPFEGSEGSRRARGATLGAHSEPH